MATSIKIPKGVPTKIPKMSDAISQPYNYKVYGPELKLHDQYAKEHTRRIGTQVDYFCLNIPDSIIDPVYGEAIAHNFSKAFKIFGYLSWPNPSFDAREDGTHTTFTGSLWLARKELEDVGMPLPREGDVVRFWDTAYYNFAAANDRKVEGAGMFFDVFECKDDGHLFDSPYFVGFKLDIKRRTEFGPERKLGEM